MGRPRRKSTAAITRPSTNLAKSSALLLTPGMARSKASNGSVIPTGSLEFNGIRSGCRMICSRSACSSNSSLPHAPVRPSLTRRRLALFLVSGFVVPIFGGFMISLAGKAALITGGSRGIGAATVKLFAQAGADVVFNYVKAKDAALQVQQEAGKHGTRVEAFKADVGKHADNQKLVEHTIARLGRLDILVANAGIWNREDAPIEKMTEKQWDDMIRINLKSVYSFIHFTVPH